jgi:hypothetical protein
MSFDVGGSGVLQYVAALPLDYNVEFHKTAVFIITATRIPNFAEKNSRHT